MREPDAIISTLLGSCIAVCLHDAEARIAGVRDQVPEEHRARLLFRGIVAALVLRGLAILGGVALIEQFHFVIYVLGVLLLVLAYRILRGVAENVDPDNNFVVKGVRRFFPVTGEYHDSQWFVKLEGRRYVTPLFLCLAAIVPADIAFAVDSIPAAFAITRDSVLIWMGNVFALLGLRALFVLVEGLIRRFRYLDETIAVVLALVAVKLLIEGEEESGSPHFAALLKEQADRLACDVVVVSDTGMAAPDVPSAVTSVRIAWFWSILSSRAFSTFRILPHSGRIAWNRRSRPCLADPPAESPSTM